MDRFIADLHIHSPFSRATSKKLLPRNLAAWAEIKGLDVVATGDFTHPKWLEILEEELVEVEEGLFELKNKQGLAKEIPGFFGELKGKVRFILSAEISSIYKKRGKVRKIHNLVYVPSLDKAKELNRKLAEIGNLHSDGRPILGLDAKDLLDMVLELDSKAFLVPAHIWTPWFSLFGSKSGFDSIEECFEDLSKYIFALETGLSSDPEMNWLLSKLDRFFLVSNSDAHSGENLAREANIFQGEVSYTGIYYALRGEGLSHKFLGTLEFYPEEGKYHLDGHRKCKVVLTPQETLSRGGICPVCGQKLTVGVLHRVLALADRKTPQKPKHHPDYTSLIPLKEILSEFLGVGPKSKKVNTLYVELIEKFGSELDILLNVPLEDLKQKHSLLGEAVARMRRREVLRQPGFDGEYGKISLFTPKELQEILQGKSLFVLGQESKKTDAVKELELIAEEKQESFHYNEEQERAIGAKGPLLVIAGPGTGKTQTLLGRVKKLLEEGINPRHILILTFTRKAAQEIRERLLENLQEKVLPVADTLHALAYEYWQKVHKEKPLILEEEEAKKVFARANPRLSSQELKEKWAEFCLKRERREECSLEGENYFNLKKDLNLVDYADLLEFWLHELEVGNFLRPYTHLLVDEVQDLSPLQLDLIVKLAPEKGEGFFAIGDPRQAIYGFRGAVTEVESYLKQYWPELEVIFLHSNYRSGQKILDLAGGLFTGTNLKARKRIEAEVCLLKAPSDNYEAFWIANKVKDLLGGSAHFEADNKPTQYSPGDIAILVRFRALVKPFVQALKNKGIPVASPEEEAFFKEPRIELILKEVEKVLGFNVEKPSLFPESVLAAGPRGIKNFLKDIPPFDPLFWESNYFKQLEKLYAQENGWLSLINFIRLESELDLVREKSQRVRVMTLHASKGLEFEVVFLPCLEDGLLPFIGVDKLVGAEKEGSFDLEEEKRLFYVGLTRAKSHLFLSFAQSRKLYGKRLNLPPSRFLDLLDSNLFELKEPRKKTSLKEKQHLLFS